MLKSSEIDKEKIIFLLGGHDLEMCTIKELLCEQGVRYFDAGLRWDNARLSAYAPVLEQYGNSPDWTICGVELEVDVPKPRKYKVIDHHNENSDKPSALEQVAEILRVPLDRYRQLVAANDKGYILGMLAMGATDEEIRSIRLADRRAQGVTPEDEYLAEKAITENLKREGDLTVVRALNSRFSPICDRLYPYRALLVYTSTEWMFYGMGAHWALSLFGDELRKGKIFYGGGIDGYVGSKKHIYTEEEIYKIIKMIENEFV